MYTAPEDEQYKHNEIIEIKSLKQLLRIKMQHPGVVLDFYANWCPPCMEFKPKFAEMCKNNKNRSIVFCTVCMDSENEMAKHFDVQTIPAFFFFYRDHV